jgi:hypothetical protein
MDPEAALSRLFEPPGPVALDIVPTPAARSPDTFGYGSAQIVVDEPASVVVEASAPSGGGYLVLRDTYSTEWSAHVDGEPVEVARANGLFRAVPLAAGRHTIAFLHTPVALLWGLGISGATLLAIGAALLWSARARNENCG